MEQNQAGRQDIEELLRLSREQGRQDRELLSLFETLPRNAAFQAYIGLLNTLLGSKTGEVIAASGGVDGVIRAEYVKGSMFGMILARDLVPTIIAQMKQGQLAEGDEDDDAE